MVARRESTFLTVDEALNIIDRLSTSKPNFVQISSKEASANILAKDVVSQHDIPRFDNSAMDGFIFPKQDLENGKKTFTVDGEIRPEHNPESVEGPGEGFCKRIMTGAAVPDGDFQVIQIELISVSGDQATVQEIPDSNPVRKSGEGYRKGKPVLLAGTVMRPYESGLMIESGNTRCHILEPLRISLQVTGSEITAENNTNGPVLEGIIGRWPGSVLKTLPVLEDDPKTVKERLISLKESSDIVLTTGGISMGKHDYILSAMQELGAEVLIRKVKQKPGKPFTISRLGDTIFFHLPGNPVSAVFTAEYYVRRFLSNRLGLSHTNYAAVVEGEFSNHRDDITLFSPGRLGFNGKHQLTVSSEGVMKSHLLQLYTGNNAYVRIDPGTTCSDGETVSITPFSTLRLP